MSTESNGPRTELPEQLLEALEALLREYGTVQVSLREVARRAGVSHGAPGFHFHNKAGLLTAFAAQGYRRVIEHVAAELTAQPPVDARQHLAAIGRAYVRFALNHPEQFGVMFQVSLLNPSDPDYVASANATFAVLQSGVERCVADGLLAPERAPVVMTAAWAEAHGLAALFMSGRLQARLGKVDPMAFTARVLDAFVDRMIAAP